MNLSSVDPSLAAAMASVAIYLLLTAVVVRVAAERWQSISMLTNVAVVALPVVVWLAGDGNSSMVWRFIAFYACGVAVAIFVYGAVLKSLSLKMLDFMAATLDRSATVDQLTLAVIAPQLQERIELLKANGWVAQDGHEYMATDHGRAIAAKIGKVRAFLRIEASGLYSG